MDRDVVMLLLQIFIVLDIVWIVFSFIRGARKKNKESLRAGAKAVIKEAADQVHVFYIRKF